MMLDNVFPGHSLTKWQQFEKLMFVEQRILGNSNQRNQLDAKCITEGFFERPADASFELLQGTLPSKVLFKSFASNYSWLLRTG